LRSAVRVCEFDVAPLLRNPITGIAGCRARAATGQARRAAEQRDERARFLIELHSGPSQGPDLEDIELARLSQE